MPYNTRHLGQLSKFTVMKVLLKFENTRTLQYKIPFIVLLSAFFKGAFTFKVRRFGRVLRRHHKYIFFVADVYRD